MTFQVMKVRLSYIHPQPPEADAPLFGWGIYISINSLDVWVCVLQAAAQFFLPK